MSLSRNIPRLYAFAFLKMALFPMAIITLFWKDHIGLSLTEILLLQGLFSLATLLMEYPSGYLSDRWGYRFSLHLASLLGIAGWSLYTVADTFAGVLLAEILLGASYAFISGSDSALLFETLRCEDREDQYSLYDGRMTGMAQVGEAAGAVFAGFLYAAMPLLPFFIQIGVWITAFGICRTLKEPPQTQHDSTLSHIGEALRTCRLAFRQSRRLRYTILLAALLGLCSFFPVWLIQPYMQQSGVPLSWFGPIWAVANLTVTLGSLASYRLAFHFGHRCMLILFLVLIGGGYLGLGLAGSMGGFLFYYLLTLMRGMQGPLLRNQMHLAGSRRNRASLLSLKSLVFRLLFLLSGPLVGWWADRSGLHITFLGLGAILVVLLIPMTLLFLRNLPSGKPT